jgi:hypothetical protein
MQERHERWLIIGVDCALCVIGVLGECIGKGDDELPPLERMQG